MRKTRRELQNELDSEFNLRIAAQSRVDDLFYRNITMQGELAGLRAAVDQLSYEVAKMKTPGNVVIAVGENTFIGTPAQAEEVEQMIERWKREGV